MVLFALAFEDVMHQLRICTNEQPTIDWLDALEPEVEKDHGYKLTGSIWTVPNTQRTGLKNTYISLKKYHTLLVSYLKDNSMD